MGGAVGLFSSCKWAQSPTQLSIFVNAIRGAQEDDGEEPQQRLVVRKVHGVAVRQEQVLPRVRSSKAGRSTSTGGAPGAEQEPGEDEARGRIAAKGKWASRRRKSRDLKAKARDGSSSNSGEAEVPCRVEDYGEGVEESRGGQAAGQGEEGEASFSLTPPSQDPQEPKPEHGAVCVTTSSHGEGGSTVGKGMSGHDGSARSFRCAALGPDSKLSHSDGTEPEDLASTASKGHGTLAGPPVEIKGRWVVGGGVDESLETTASMEDFERNSQVSALPFLAGIGDTSTDHFSMFSAADEDAVGGDGTITPSWYGDSRYQDMLEDCFEGRYQQGEASGLGSGGDVGGDGNDGKDLQDSRVGEEVTPEEELDDGGNLGVGVVTKVEASGGGSVGAWHAEHDRTEQNAFRVRYDVAGNGKRARKRLRQKARLDGVWQRAWDTISPELKAEVEAGSLSLSDAVEKALARAEVRAG